MVAILDGNGCHHRWQPVAIMAINDGNGPSRMTLVAINDGNRCHQGWHGWQPIAVKDGNGSPSMMATIAIHDGIDGNPLPSMMEDGNPLHQG